MSSGTYRLSEFSALPVGVALTLSALGLAQSDDGSKAVGAIGRAVKNITSTFVLVTSLTLAAPATAGPSIPLTVSSPGAHAYGMAEFSRGVATAEIARLRIKALSDYGDDWAGPQSRGASDRGVASAVLFTDYIGRLDPSLAPRINLSADGELGFFWRSPKVIIDLGFNRHGTGSYFARLNTGKEFMVDRLARPFAFPREVEEALIG